MSIDTDLAPIDPAAPVEPAPDAHEEPSTPTPGTGPAPGARTAPPAGHTPGGIPAIPAAIATANTTIGLVSAAALTGGPMAAALAAAGAAAIGGAAVSRAGSRPRRKPSRPSAKTNSKTGGSRDGGSQGGRGAGSAGHRSGSGGRRNDRRTGPGNRSVPPQNRKTSTAMGSVGLTKTPAKPGAKTPSPARTLRASTTAAKHTAPGHAGRGGGLSSGSTTGTKQPRTGRTLRGALRPGKNGHTPGRTGAGHGATGHGNGKHSAPGKHGSLRKPGGSRAGKTLGRLGAIRALREHRKNTAPTRKARREQALAARRALADRRRAAKAETAAGKTPARGRAARALHKALGKVRDRRGAAIGAARRARDQRTARKAVEARRNLRKQHARRAARRQLIASAARCWARRAAAAALAAPIGVLGAATTPIGRKFGAAWLMYPGRRLLRRLAAKALADRQQRDTAIRARRAQAEKAADTDTDDTPTVTGKVPRGARGHAEDLTPDPTYEGDFMSGFNFTEAAAEMETAAQTYAPEGMMQVVAMIEGLPDALASMANVFKTLAEKSDSEFPLEPEVGEGFSAIYTQMMAIAEAAEDLVTVTHRVHEKDIARHREPRNNAEAGWDTVNNDD
ncbi:hypothetical protein GCM10010406_21290 [Streptomyces thermolineatus]|uniref:Uncharacterized protein n=1 Tax=Streptomyces thermolineatus TaxID=44033 RepID=A0ABN3LM07_9ACTN